jgi:hypothetical protein
VPAVQLLDEAGFLPAIVAGIAMVFKLNSVLLRGVRARAAERVRTLSDAIAAKVRESIGHQPRPKS